MAKPTAVELSTWVGVAGCGCPILMRAVQSGMASWPLRNVAAILALAAEARTFLRILQTV